MLSTLADFLTPEAFAKFHHAAIDPAGLYRMPLGKQQERTIEEVLVLDQATGLPISASVFITPSKTPDVPAQRVLFSDWKLNVPVDEGQFVYVPPATATLYTPPKLLATGI